MCRTIIHIGLHKTASTFIQKTIFRMNSDLLNYIYNPKQIFDLLIPVFEFEFDSEEWIESLRDAYKKWRRENPSQTLLLSSESLSQLLYTQDFEKKISLLTQIFGKIELIVVLRNQVDWIHSVYRETLKSGDYQSLSEFIGYDPCRGDIRPSKSRFNNEGLLTMDPSKSNWHQLVLICTSNPLVYKCNVLFFEELKSEQEKFLRSIVTILDSSAAKMPLVKFEEKPLNKGISGGGILFLLGVSSFFHKFGFKKGYYRQQNRQRTIMARGVSRYLALRDRRITGFELFVREWARLRKKISLYSMIVWLDSFMPKRFHYLKYDPHIDNIDRLVFEMHKDANERLFRLLNREAVIPYCRDRKNED